MNGNVRYPFLLALAVGLLFSSTKGLGAEVQVREDVITIPTYLVDEPEPSPIFYDGRGSQGAQGRVYPYPLYDRLTHVKSNKVYRVVYLENEHVRLAILPEIGGRLFEAIDKSNGYNFIYRQHVIKPALIGLIGAWISGGIEWNIPHHHRATTALPVQYRLENNNDGSKTVWVGELEVRQRMRWAVGYTLYPGRSYLECSVRILNRTPMVNTMLCFANVAVQVNDQYQVIYPPRTQFVTFHSKHEFTTWPIATTRYAGADFTRGVDVSWYSNHVSANSMFAWNYTDDFFAGYDHGKRAGIISFADHRIVPGKKFWTWGNGPRGRMWDKILTDSDGPYIELMAGAYSDNQPDYSWLQPHETKSFKMYWYPFEELDGLKNANLDAAVNLELATNHVARVGFCATRAFSSANAVLRAGTNILLQEAIKISPGKPYTKQVAVPPDIRESDLHAELIADGRILIEYTPVQQEPGKMPEPVKDAPPPQDIKTIEELYLAGQRIEQFHAAGTPPEKYWEEALRRDPGDARVNTVLGIRQLKQARFPEAEAHFRTAIERLTRNYTSPRDGEPFYYLGLALQSQFQIQPDLPKIYEDARDALAKASWSQAWRGPANFSLAQLASVHGNPAAALDYAQQALAANALDVRALALNAALLRQMGDPAGASRMIELATTTTDPLDTRLLSERWLLGDTGASNRLAQIAVEFPTAVLETAVEYGDDGLWTDGVNLLRLMSETSAGKVSPLAYYYLGEYYERLHEPAKAADARKRGAQGNPDYVFPFQWEAIAALQHACEQDPRDSHARYYLGNLLFEWQPATARTLWEESASIEPSFAMAHRNLALAYANEQTDEGAARAVAELEKAVKSPMRYALHFAELDALYAKAKTPPAQRLELLQSNESVVSQRDDALSKEIGLLVFVGQYDRAIQLMAARQFSVWEGGSLDVAQHWVNAHLLRARKQLAAGKLNEALADLQAARSIPDNLPNDNDNASRGPELSFWKATVYARMAEPGKAEQAWKESAAAQGTLRDGDTASQLQRCYAAMAQDSLGQRSKAESSLNELLQAAEKRLANPSEKPSRRDRRAGDAARVHLLAGLAQSGLHHPDQAAAQFKLALEIQPDCAEAQAELAALH